MLYQITEPRLRELDGLWGSRVNEFRGPIPRSLGLCHMLAETDGDEQPVTHTLTRRTVGIMRLPIRDTQRLGYAETAASTPRTNIYLWCRLANQYAEQLHRDFPGWWQTANLDFWLAVRLVFVLGVLSTENLLKTVGATSSTYRSTAAVLTWIRTVADPQQRFGSCTRFDLLRLADHLDQVLAGMRVLDGPQYVAAHFSERIPAPNNDEALFTNTKGYTARTEYR